MPMIPSIEAAVVAQPPRCASSRAPTAGSMLTRSERLVRAARRARNFAVVAAVAVSNLCLLPDAWAQSASRIPRIGILAERSASDPTLIAFREGLRDLGYVEGRNVRLEWRYGSGAVETYPVLLRELVALDVDILVVGGAVAARAAKAASPTIPIVFTSVGDPVAAGLAANLSHPGGNVTGLSNVIVELSGKQLELLKLVQPRVSRVAVLHNPLNSGPALVVTREAARRLRLELRLIEMRRPTDLDAAVAGAAGWRAEALLALSDPVIGNSLPGLAQLTRANGMASIYSRAEFTDVGGLLAYGPSFPANYRRAAAYVDRILKGAKAGDLPIEQPTTFELVVNMKTARTLGIAVPQQLLERADRVID